MVFFAGSLYYCGSHGSLKKVFNRPRLFSKATRLKTQSSSFLDDTVKNSALFWRVEIRCKSLVMTGWKSYMIVEKEHPSSWLAMNTLYRGHKHFERTIKVFDT